MNDINIQFNIKDFWRDATITFQGSGDLWRAKARIQEIWIEGPSANSVQNAMDFLFSHVANEISAGNLKQRAGNWKLIFKTNYSIVNEDEGDESP